MLPERNLKALKLLDLIPSYPGFILKTDLAQALDVTRSKLEMILYAYTWTIPVSEEGDKVSIISEKARESCAYSYSHDLVKKTTASSAFHC